MELTKQALFNVATERFKSWSEMYADPDVTPEYMYQDMCASCFSGELDFDWEDRYIYDEYGGCSFKHKGVAFDVYELRDMRGQKSHTDIAILSCTHRDEDISDDDCTWPHYLPDSYLFGAQSDDFEEGKEVDARFISEADKYIDKIGRKKLIELQKKED